MDRMKTKNLKSIQNIIDTMSSDPKLLMHQTFSLKSSSDMIHNVRDNMMVTINPTERTKKHTHNKTNYDNFITLDSTKHRNKNSQMSNRTINKSFLNALFKNFKSESKHERASTKK